LINVNKCVLYNTVNVHAYVKVAGQEGCHTLGRNDRRALQLSTPPPSSLAHSFTPPAPAGRPSSLAHSFALRAPAGRPRSSVLSISAKMDEITSLENKSPSGSLSTTRGSALSFVPPAVLAPRRVSAPPCAPPCPGSTTDAHAGFSPATLTQASKAASARPAA